MIKVGLVFSISNFQLWMSFSYINSALVEIKTFQGLPSHVGQYQDPGKLKEDPSKQYIVAETSLLGSTNLI